VGLLDKEFAKYTATNFTIPAACESCGVVNVVGGGGGKGAFCPAGSVRAIPAGAGNCSIVGINTATNVPRSLGLESAQVPCGVTTMPRNVTETHLIQSSETTQRDVTITNSGGGGQGGHRIQWLVTPTSAKAGEGSVVTDGDVRLKTENPVNATRTGFLDHGESYDLPIVVQTWNHKDWGSQGGSWTGNLLIQWRLVNTTSQNPISTLL
jgi:hypothetical protein